MSNTQARSNLIHSTYRRRVESFWESYSKQSCCCCCCCLTLETVPIFAQYLLTSVLVQLTRTRLPWSQANYPKGVYIMKNQREIKGTRKINIHAIVGKKQKNKAPDGQTSQATCRAKEIDRAHRSHSTREAKQNKTNKKNHGSPIKTIKSHYICTPTRPGDIHTWFAPAMPFPTHTYKCVGGAQDHKSLVWSHVVGWPPPLPCARRS